MRMQPMVRAAIAVAVVATAGAGEAAGGSFACEDNFGTLKEIKAQVGGSSTFISIVNQYVTRWDARKARQLCEAYAAGTPVTITCLDGRRDWGTIKGSIPPEYFGGSTEGLADAYRAERRQGNGYGEAMDYCRSVGAIR